MGTIHLTKRTTDAPRFLLIGVLLLVLSLGNVAPPTARAATPGLPFTEDFSDTNLRDSSLTNANWSTEEQALVLAWRRAQHGAFGPGLAGGNISADAQATYAVALGDMDGDGDLDMVIGNNGQANRLYLNNGTADPFSGVSGSDISADTQATFSVELGDVDGDGDLDLMAGNYNQANRLYLNSGTANPFNGISGSDVSTDTHNTISVVLGDVDGDGDLDLVAGNYHQVNRLYLNNGTSDPFSGVSGDNISSDAHYTWSVALGDVDGDGDPDLVAGNTGQANRLYLNNGTADPFSGVSGSDISTDAYTTLSVALEDVDGDGDLDLVTGNGNNQANRLYLNNGTASPFSGVSGSDIGTDASNTMSVVLGDVDGDGDLDLVVGNDGQANRLYLNSGTASPFNGVSGDNISSDTHHTYSVALGDVDRDGDLDLVAGNYGQANRLYLNNGTADPFSGVSGSDISADEHDTESVALGDVDRDGDLDLVTGNYGQANRLYLNNGTADPFNEVGGSDASADAYNTYSAALGDVDGDGGLDLVTGNNGANRLYLNGETASPFGGINGSAIGTDTGLTNSMALGDVDGDGDLDVVVENDASRWLYLNNGTASPFSGVSGSIISPGFYWNTFSMALGDVDGDGDLDLVAGGLGVSKLYLNNGTASPFNGVSGSDIGTGTDSTYAVALGDVDRDGDLDLVAGNYNHTNRLYLNNGTADPLSGVSGSDIGADTDSTTSVALGDVDGDGDLDLVAGNSGQTNRLYLNNGTADPFSGVSGSNVCADTDFTRSVALGDVDGDGDLDVVAGNQGQVNRVCLNNGTANPFGGVSSQYCPDSQRSGAH